MNWRVLSSLIQFLLNFPGCILIFFCCAGATIGLLYLQNPIDIGLQYLPALASAAYFLSRSLYALDNGISVSKNEILGYAFIVSVSMSVALQMYLGIDAIDRAGQSSLDVTVAMAFFNICYFFAGAACSRAAYRKSDIVAIFLVLMVVIPFINAPKQGLFVDYWLLRQATGLDQLTHLSISEWCVFFFIGAFAFASDKLRPMIIVVTAIVLFGLQGRSSTFFTLFTLLFFWMLTGGKKTVLIYGGICAVGLLAFTVTPIGDLLMGSDSRALDRMLVSEGDRSLEGRKDIFWESLQHLPKLSSMLHGDPSYIAYEAGSMGSYIHNILSMWQFFGLLPFILILVILVRGLLVMKARMGKSRLSVMEEFACMLLIYSSVSVIFSKSVIFYWLWFAAGYWMLRYSGSARKMPPKATRKRRRKRKRRSKVRTQQTKLSKEESFPELEY